VQPKIGPFNWFCFLMLYLVLAPGMLGLPQVVLEIKLRLYIYFYARYRIVKIQMSWEWVFIFNPLSCIFWSSKNPCILWFWEDPYQTNKSVYSFFKSKSASNQTRSTLIISRKSQGLIRYFKKCRGCIVNAHIHVNVSGEPW